MYIKFNFQRGIWEAYRENPIVRGGEKQPSFVSPSRDEVSEYIKNVEGYGNEH